MNKKILNKKWIDSLFILLFFTILFGVFVAKDGYILYKSSQNDEQTYSISSPGTLNSEILEDIYLYMPSFREIYDFQVPWSDDYIYENKSTLQPTPIVPKILGGLLLILSFGNTDILMIWVFLFCTLSYFLIYKCFLKLGFSPLSSLGAVLITLIPSAPYISIMRGPIDVSLKLGINPIISTVFLTVLLIVFLWFFLKKKQYIFHKILSPRVLSIFFALVIGVIMIVASLWLLKVIFIEQRSFEWYLLRLYSPSLTFFFLVAFLFYLFQDPLIQHRKSSLLIGGVGGFNFYVLYGNFYCISIFLACYLTLLFFLYPKNRKNYFKTVFFFLLTILPFMCIYIISMFNLPEEYMLKVGMSQYTTEGRYHWAPQLEYEKIIQYFSAYILAPVFLCLFIQAFSYRLEYSQKDRYVAPSVLQYLQQSFTPQHLSLLAVGMMGVITYISPIFVQELINLPQPDRIFQRSGGLFPRINSILFIWISFKVLLTFLPKFKQIYFSINPKINNKIRFIAYLIIILILSLGSMTRLNSLNDIDFKTHVIDDKYLLVLEMLKEGESPCVLSSSDGLLISLVTARTSCDVLGPNILTSSISTEEALDRFVAIWIIENKSLSSIYKYFRLDNILEKEPYRENCFLGRGYEKNNMLDGLLIVFHHGPCNPLKIKDLVKKSFQKYNKKPELIFENYRVDWIYSRSGNISHSIQNIFQETNVKGMFKKLD